MNWSDIGSTILKDAPIIGTLLGGPIGVTVAAVGGLVSSALGVENTPEAVSVAIAADPTAAEKIKEAELNSKVQLQQLLVTQEQNRLQFSLQTYQAETSDRNSARDLAAKQPKDWMRPVLGLIIVIATIGMVGAILSGAANDVIKNPTSALTAGTIIGYMFNEAKSVLGFYFGQTQDSAKANEAVRNFAISPGTVTGLNAPALPAPNTTTTN